MINIARESTVYLDGVEYVRVYYTDSIYFEDIRRDCFDEWLKVATDFDDAFDVDDYSDEVAIND